LPEFPGAVFIVRVRAEKIFPNCPRYIHKMQLVEHSAYAPRPEYTPPVPVWKTFDAFKDALPARDRSDDQKEYGLKRINGIPAFVAGTEGLPPCR